jgi:hypothetical protein
VSPVNILHVCFYPLFILYLRINSALKKREDREEGGKEEQREKRKRAEGRAGKERKFCPF